jgi:hypothetical protein
MSGGGLVQLAAVGAQDVVLTQSPEITFFSALYRQYINFAMEEKPQSFTGTQDFGNEVQLQVNRNGDLIMQSTLEVTLPAVSVTGENATFQWAPMIGNTLIKHVIIEIGGVDIDKHWGDFYNIWNELTIPEEKREGYNSMIGQQNLKYNKSDPADIVVYEDGLQTPLATQPQTVLHIPLQFWFCVNAGLALPLIALQYHDVRFKFQFRPFAELYRITGTNVTIVGGAPHIPNMKLWINYVVMDNAERKNIAQSPSEYLITQLQHVEESITQSTYSFNLHFNHPCKELIWTIQENYVVLANVNDWTNWEVANNTYVGYSPVTNGVPGDDPITTGLLKINGNDRFTTRIGEYFNKVVPYYFHSRVPKSNGVFVYSFALKPEDYQPSGTCNFSRIDNAQLALVMKNINTSNPGKGNIYAINYQLLRIANGMGGIAYAS